MNAAYGRAFLYAATALVVTALWTIRAKTEHQDNDFSSITALAHGTVRLPFVKRRLLADAARGRRVDRAQKRLGVRQRSHRRRTAPGARFVRDTLGWKRGDDPILLSATALIALSVVGFMLAMRALILQLYETSGWWADGCALALGWALLGGGGDIRFGFYPYDLPQTCMFALTLSAMIARSVWLPLVFALAAYSKETSLLLILAYVSHSSRTSVAKLDADRHRVGRCLCGRTRRN